MKTLTRRSFIKTTIIASASLSPVAAVLAAYGISAAEIEAALNQEFDKNPQFHLVDNNLLNLRFYFLNVKRNGGSLSPNNPTQRSFMIVRLPQQHISEAGFWSANWGPNPYNNKPFAILSGFSYLAFSIWPDEQSGAKHSKSIQFNLQTLLNWNVQKNFKLITLIDWLHLKNAGDAFAFADVINCEEFKNKKIWKANDYSANQNGTMRVEGSEPQSDVFRRYKSIVTKLFDGDTKPSPFIPVTFFEVPYQVCLVPIVRNNQEQPLPTKVKFWDNKLAPININTSHKYEIWNNSLFLERPKSSDSASNESKGKSDSAASHAKQEFVFETPSFRIVGLIANNSTEFPCPTENQECSVKENHNQKELDLLPSLLDKAELAYLTQYAKKELEDEDRTQVDFDIKELNGFLVTGLGVITHLKYETQKNLPVDKKIDLIEYEHQITQGRDIFIKVARLGYNSKTGQKYKHVIEGKRKIQTEAVEGQPVASFIELKQYCECIEREIDYAELSSTAWSEQRFIKYLEAPADSISAPLGNNDCHYRRGPFTALKITDRKRVPIDCLRDVVFDVATKGVCELEKQEWFWVIKEGPKRNPDGSALKNTDVPIERYVTCHYEATDWEGQTYEAATPFMFIRAAYFYSLANTPPLGTAPDAYQDYLNGDYQKQNPRDPLVERKLTYFNGQKIAFSNTPKPPSSTNLSGGELPPAYDSKPNILETDYLESYFNLKKIDKESLKHLAETKYVVFPQVLRARVYLDHVRDITQNKIASVVDYHDDYIKGGFDEDFISKEGQNLKNYGKLILKTTDAYTHLSNALEEPINQTYDTIKTALQQAKNQLGNLAIPDIIPNVVSLDRSGITLPPDITKAIHDGKATFDKDLEKLTKLDPRQLLRGKLSEILGGIDLLAILDELIPQENSPLFEIRKLTTELQQIEQNLVNSPTYQQVLKDLNAVKSEIDNALKEVNGLLLKINNARLTINSALHKISTEFPNVDELDSNVKKLFERYRIRVFDVLLDDLDLSAVKQAIDDVRTRVTTFLSEELQILRSEYDAKATELNQFFDEVQNELKQLPDDLKMIAGQEVDKYVKATLHGLYDQVLKPNFDNYQQKIDQLFRTVADDAVIEAPVPGGSTAKVYYKVIGSESLAASGPGAPGTIVTWELTNDSANAKPLFDLSAGAGYVQLNKKISDFKTFIAGNLQHANEFQNSAIKELLNRVKGHETELASIQSEVEKFETDKLEPLAKNIRDWNKKAEAFRVAANDPVIKDAVKRVQELVLKANLFVDFLRKVDPYFYYREEERLKKDIEDVKRRFFGSLADLFGLGEWFDKCPVTTAYDPSNPPPLMSITDEIQQCICVYEGLRESLFNSLHNPDPSYLQIYVQQFEAQVKSRLSSIKQRMVDQIQNDPAYKELKTTYDSLNRAKNDLTSYQAEYEKKYKAYLALVRDKSAQIAEPVTKAIQDHIDQWERQLADEVNPTVIEDVQSKINEARNIYRLLTSIKQQNLSYTWSTTHFHDVNLGILTFKKGSDPDTRLDVDVKIITYFTPGKFPPTIQQITTSSSASITNFSVGFFNVLTVGFSDVSFRSASGESPFFGVKIKDVKFDGALSFVQQFENWLAGRNLVLQIQSDSLVLGYSLSVPSIQTPAFSFFNLSLNLDLRLYFDNRPMRIGFSFARPDLKFGISAGIYAGFGFFGLVGDPKRGIVGIDCALEAGAWLGISLGPLISGELKLAFGFRYTRNDSGVRLEGYVVAEGRLKVWILEISARIYLGVVSENSYVEGQCTVSYEVKLGFISKSFSGTFHQKIAGAESNNHEANARKLLAYNLKVSASLDLPSSNVDLYSGHVGLLTKSAQAEPELVTAPVSREAWKRFARIM
jgi:hypothetical protein